MLLSLTRDFSITPEICSRRLLYMKAGRKQNADSGSSAISPAYAAQLAGL